MSHTQHIHISIVKMIHEFFYRKIHFINFAEIFLFFLPADKCNSFFFFFLHSRWCLIWLRAICVCGWWYFEFILFFSSSIYYYSFYWMVFDVSMNRFYDDSLFVIIIYFIRNCMQFACKRLLSSYLHCAFDSVNLRVFEQSMNSVCV